MRKATVFLALTLASAGMVAAGSMGKLEVGQPFPDLTFTPLEGGDAVSLERYRGQKVVLHVFASW